jgi:signal transduction histidine kinase
MRDTSPPEDPEEGMPTHQKLDLVARLAAGIAHELDTNLAAIVLYGQVCLHKRDLAPGTERRLLEAIIEESRRAADLMERILDASHHGVVETQPVSLAPLVQETMSYLRPTIPETIQVTTELTPRPCIIEADPNRIQRALVNLVHNAQDAMPEGGELSIRVEQVATEVGEERRRDRREGDGPSPPRPGEWACLTVSDTGIGMTEEMQQHLFEPFFTTKPPGKGVGLGLAQVHGIVRQHGGFVDVDTAPGRGTTVFILLPLRTSEPSAFPHRDRVEDGLPRFGGAGHRGGSSPFAYRRGGLLDGITCRHGRI